MKRLLSLWSNHFTPRLMGSAFSTLHPQVSTVPVITKVPPEVLAMIVGHLADDKKSLFACSLTCRRLHSCAREQLFRQISLESKDLSTFCGLLESVAQCVYDLEFVGLGHRTSLERCGSADFKQLVSRLDGVKSLTLNGIDLFHVPPNNFSSFPNVTDLCLTNLRFDSFADFVNLVTSFRSLSTLSLRWVSWTPRPALAMNDNHWPSLPRIRFIELNDKNAVDIASWLLQDGLKPFIRVLHFSTHKFTPNNAVRRLIEASRDSIESLKFDLTFANDIPDNLHNSVDLGICTNLRSIHLHNIMLDPAIPMSIKTTRWVPVLLSQISSHHLEEVVITVLVNHNPHLNCFDWAGTAVALSEAQFVNVRKILFRVKYFGEHFDQRDAEKSIMTGPLSPFAARGVLGVDISLAI